VAALEAVRARRPDLVLTDVMMPRLDGFELLRELRADPATVDLPVIMLSARAGEESRVEGMEAGADDYLVKPFSARELLARVGAHLQMARLRRESEQAVREGRELLRVTLASIGDAIITTDTAGRVTYLNAAAESLTGWKNDEAAGQPLETVFRVVNEQTRRPVENPATRALREGVIVGLANHSVLIGKGGTEQPIDDSAAPIKDEQGHVGGCVLIFRDVAERRQVEKRIYGLMIELREADRRKDEFLATLAHELRNPLAPLGNMLEIMKRANGDGGLIEQARGTMERQFGQLVRLVDDLLDVSRITRNKLELRKERVELASVVRQTVENCCPLAEGFKHEVTVTLPPEPIYLHADPVRLSQVFNNLFNNACKYTEPKGHVWLTAERQGGDVVVTVKDTGLGIPPDKLAGVFEMFTQVDRSLDRSRGGLGIGLTLVKRLVEMHGGSVAAFSEGPGRGSEFVVRLPVLTEGRTAEAPEPAAERMPAAARRILVVDDNLDSAASLALLLKMTGHETHTAHDGPAAIEAAERFSPDVILLDIGLPKLNGYEVARRIREQPWGQNMVLVALTGWGQEEDRVKSKDAGFDAHMVKPVDYDTLMKLLASPAAEQGGQRTTPRS
jgi:PAS domain S-box-containing protein